MNGTNSEIEVWKVQKKRSEYIYMYIYISTCGWWRGEMPTQSAIVRNTGKSRRNETSLRSSCSGVHFLRNLNR